MPLCPQDELMRAIDSVNTLFNHPERALTIGCRIELGAQMMASAIADLPLSDREGIAARACKRVLIQSGVAAVAAAASGRRSQAVH